MLEIDNFTLIILRLEKKACNGMSIQRYFRKNIFCLVAGSKTGQVISYIVSLHWSKAFRTSYFDHYVIIASTNPTREVVRNSFGSWTSSFNMEYFFSFFTSQKVFFSGCSISSERKSGKESKVVEVSCFFNDYRYFISCFFNNYFIKLSLVWNLSSF